MNVDLNRFDKILCEIAEVEQVPLEDLHLFWDGVEVKKSIADISVEDFKFTGLMNRDFISILLNEIMIS